MARRFERALVFGAVLTLSTSAAADGERSPMFGGAMVAAAVNEHAFGGGELDASWWHWRVGLGADGAMMWTAGDRVTMLSLSARLLVFDTLVESWLEPRDVELGIELQGIIERAWWSHDDMTDTTRYGVGVALRLRGGGDYDNSNLLAESRVFVRVMAEPASVPGAAVARMLEPPVDRDTAQVTIMIGIGAAFGSGEANYLERFRRRPFSKLAAYWPE